MHRLDFEAVRMPLADPGAETHRKVALIERELGTGIRAYRQQRDKPYNESDGGLSIHTV